MKKISKKLNRIIFIIYAIVLLLSIAIFNVSADTLDEDTNTNAQSYIQQITSELFGDISIKSCEYLYNLDESPDYIYVEFEKSGYVVYSSQTLDVLEYSLNETLPYSANTRKYYTGPTSYINKTENGFENVVTKELISENDISSFTQQSKDVLSHLKSEKRSTHLNSSWNFNANLNEISQFSTGHNESTDEELPNGLSHSGNDTISGGGLGFATTYINNAEYFIIGPHHGQNQVSCLLRR